MQNANNMNKYKVKYPTETASITTHNYRNTWASTLSRKQLSDQNEHYQWRQVAYTLGNKGCKLGKPMRFAIGG